MINYKPSDHYWIVGDDETKLWSSARAGYVGDKDEDLVAWQEAGGMPARIVSEEELGDVLAEAYPAGWPRGQVASKAQAALEDSDRVVLRCYEAGVPVPTPWRDYREALRYIAGSGEVKAWPKRPDYPVGS